jgi:hypothetical protein
MAPPTLTLPEDGSYQPFQRPPFDWTDVFGAAGYTIQVSREVGFTKLVMTGTVTNPTSTFMPTAKLTGGPLYWRVRANGPNGPSAWSSPWTVTVPNPPSTPALLTPRYGALVRDTTPRFDWAISTVPAGTAFAHYQLQIQENYGRIAYDINVDSLTSHEYTPSTSLPYWPAWYWWRVRAVNTAGEASDWAPWRWFYLAP